MKSYQQRKKFKKNKIQIAHWYRNEVLLSHMDMRYFAYLFTYLLLNLSKNMDSSSWNNSLKLQKR